MASRTTSLTIQALTSAQAAPGHTVLVATRKCVVTDVDCAVFTPGATGKLALLWA
jgi:hypothetical protein